jgi:hypothetical protein
VMLRGARAGRQRERAGSGGEHDGCHDFGPHDR